MLKAGGCAKVNPPPVAVGWGTREGVEGGAGDPPGPPPKANTPALLLAEPKALAPPNWNPPPADRQQHEG